MTCEIWSMDRFARTSHAKAVSKYVVFTQKVGAYNNTEFTYIFSLYIPNHSLCR